VASISLPAVLTLGEASATLAGLLDAISADPAPVLDATSLQTLDSSAIAVLLQCRRAALAQGKLLRIVAAPCKLGELAQLYGVDELLGAEVAEVPASTASA
jgi:phospholipid transport system transporter-binding protein